jgi:hypothetical protein
MKEFEMALSARDMSSGRVRICCIVPDLIIIPSMGGSKIRARNTIIADEYTAYLTGFFAESLSNVSVILWFGNVFSPSLDVNP